MGRVQVSFREDNEIRTEDSLGQWERVGKSNDNADSEKINKSESKNDVKVRAGGK